MSGQSTKRQLLSVKARVLVAVSAHRGETPEVQSRRQAGLMIGGTQQVARRAGVGIDTVHADWAMLYEAPREARIAKRIATGISVADNGLCIRLEPSRRLPQIVKNKSCLCY